MRLLRDRPHRNAVGSMSGIVVNTPVPRARVIYDILADAQCYSGLVKVFWSTFPIPMRSRAVASLLSRLHPVENQLSRALAASHEQLEASRSWHGCTAVPGSSSDLRAGPSPAGLASRPGHQARSRAPQTSRTCARAPQRGAGRDGELKPVSAAQASVEPGPWSPPPARQGDGAAIAAGRTNPSAWPHHCLKQAPAAILDLGSPDHVRHRGDA